MKRVISSKLSGLFLSLSGEYESLNRTPQILKLYFRVCRWPESGWDDRDELFPTYLRRLSAVSVSSNPLERKARKRRRGGAETRRTRSFARLSCGDACGSSSERITDKLEARIYTSGQEFQNKTKTRRAGSRLRLMSWMAAGSLESHLHQK